MTRPRRRGLPRWRCWSWRCCSRAYVVPEAFWTAHVYWIAVLMTLM